MVSVAVLRPYALAAEGKVSTHTHARHGGVLPTHANNSQEANLSAGTVPHRERCDEQNN